MLLRTLLTIAMLSALGMSANASDYVRIKKKADYVNAVVGKKITGDWGWVVANPDGSIVGEINGEAAHGKWNWQGGFWCREIKYGASELPRDCLTVHISGNNLVTVRERGKGKQTSAKLK